MEKSESQNVESLKNRSGNQTSYYVEIEKSKGQKNRSFGKSESQKIGKSKNQTIEKY